MRIAVNIGGVSGSKTGTSDFLKEAFLRIAGQHPEHQFIFFLNERSNKLECFPPNVTVVTIAPNPEGFFSLKWCFDVKIPFALKKYKADTLISVDVLLGFLTKIPQILILPDLSFLHNPWVVPKGQLHFQKLYMPKFLRKAKGVITSSAFLKNLIVEKFKVQGDKITILSGVANELYKPIEWKERESLKEKYAEGYEYFLFESTPNAEQDHVNILKAFSLFKIRQRSGIKLLIASGTEVNDGTLLEKLKTYKFRDEVKVLPDLSADEKAQVVGGSYAFVYLTKSSGFGLTVLEAIQSGVPVIVSREAGLEEIAVDAALYTDAHDPTNIAEQLKVIFKDEQLRSKLIEAGKLQAVQFSWDKTLTTLWRVITEAITK